VSEVNQYGAGVLAAVLASAVGSGALASYALSRSRDRKLKPADYRRMAQDTGAHTQTPIVRSPLMEGNAAYVPPEMADELREMGVRTPAKAKQYGAVVLPKRQQVDESVIAHEMGHAGDFRENKRSMWPYALSGLGSLVGGGVASAALARHGVGPALLGGAVGGLVGSLPRLWYEYQASRRADNYTSKDPEIRWPARRRLAAAYLTYLLAGATGGTAGGYLGFRLGSGR